MSKVVQMVQDGSRLFLLLDNGMVIWKHIYDITHPEKGNNHEDWCEIALPNNCYKKKKKIKPTPTPTSGRIR